MGIQIRTLDILLVITVLILLWVFFNAAKFKNVTGNKPILMLLGSYIIWAVAYSMISISPSLEGKIFWAKASYLGSTFITPFWLIFAARYTGYDRWLTKKVFAIILGIPWLIILVAWTNDSHHLIWTRIWLEGNNLTSQHSIGYWFAQGYYMICFFWGICLLGIKLTTVQEHHRRQIVAIIAGGLLEILNQYYFLVEQDLTNRSFIFSFGALAGIILFSYGLFRFDFFEITPIARDLIVEHMGEGYVVLDQSYRLVDINPSARKTLGIQEKETYGKPILDLIPDPNFFDAAQGVVTGASTEIPIQDRVFEINNWPVSIRGGKNQGYAILLHDVTERKKAEQTEREQRILAEALRDTASAMNSSLLLDEVLDKLLFNIGRVLPFDAVNIMMLEGNLVRIIRYQGYGQWNPGFQPHRGEYRLSEFVNLCEMVKTGQPSLIPDTQNNPHWIEVPGTEWARSYVGAPIQARGKTLGFLNLLSQTVNYYSDAINERLKIFADQAAIAITNATLYSEAEQMAMTDSLTGLNNRRTLDVVGKKEVERAVRFNHSLSAMMIDIDYFKTINDTYGHPIGDDILLKLVECIRAKVREIDIIGRYGGDEFLLLLLENDLEMAGKVAERLREAFQNTYVNTVLGPVEGTISIGVARLGPGVTDYDGLVGLADQALYRAKSTGRNRVVLLAPYIQDDMNHGYLETTLCD